MVIMVADEVVAVLVAVVVEVDNCMVPGAPIREFREIFRDVFRAINDENGTVV